MKLRIALVLLVTLGPAHAVCVSAQEPSGGGPTVENLRAELSNTQNTVADLKIRLEQLNVDLRPENIERHFSAVGSTRPEELRELRRRQLQTEKDRLIALLEELGSKSARLETAINAAQARAYQQTALGAFALQIDHSRSPHFQTFAQGLLGIVALCVVLAVMALRLLIRRRY